MGSWIFLGLFVGCICKIIFMKPVIDVIQMPCLVCQVDYLTGNYDDQICPECKKGIDL